MPRALPLSIQTHVGRRLLSLFVLSALVPIAVLAVIGYVQVRSQLTTQAESLLRQAAKSVGMGLLDQLRTAHAVLDAMPSTDSASVDRARTMFASVAVTENGRVRQLWGAAPPDAARPAPGDKVAIVVTGTNPARVWMIEGARWGEIRHDYLFEGALERAVVGGTETEVCVRSGAQVIGCDVVNAPEGRALTAAWDLFLGYDYDAGRWRVTAAQPAVSALAPILAFRRIFVGTVVIVLGVVVIVATTQVRRSMLPLLQLKDGTARIARRDFSQPVPVKGADEFGDLAKSFNVMSADLDRQFQENAHLIERLGELSYGALAALARTIDASSPWTAGHSERVTAYSLRMATLLGIDPVLLDALKRGGLLHDIGKIGIPPQILDKPGSLDPAELARIREHPSLGAKILAPLNAFADAIPIVLSHHERFDGGGYPQGLAGEKIPVLARLLAVADVYDALVSSRPYRPGWKHDEALANIRAGRGSHFDPVMVDAFFGVMDTEGDAARFSLSMEHLS